MIKEIISGKEANRDLFYPIKYYKVYFGYFTFKSINTWTPSFSHKSGLPYTCHNGKVHNGKDSELTVYKRN